MNERLRVVIAGTGMIAEVHRRAAILAGAEIIGVLGSTPARSEQVAAQWGVPGAFASLDAVIEAHPDVVHVCTPNQFHYEYSMALLEAGINVVCEKPLGLGLEEAQAMDDAAISAGVVATVPFAYRFHPMVREIRARRIAGELGELNLIHGSYLQDWMLSPTAASWRVDPTAGGRSRAFADIGSHWCDLVEWVTGQRFVEVSAATSIAYEQRPTGSAAAFSGTSGGGEMAVVTTEDIAVAQFRTDAGILASTTISQVAGGRKNRLWFELDGSKGSAVFDQENPESAWFGTAGGATVVVRDPGSNSAEAARLSSLPAGHAQGYAYCFEAFVADSYAAVRGEVRDGLPTFADGARSASIVEAVLSSAERRTWVSID
jgi:predicted dehydrogenase